MIREGTLTFAANEAQLDGVLLGIQGGQPNPVAAANNRLQTAGFGSGQRVRAEGIAGRINEVVVFFFTRITRAVVAAAIRGSSVADTDLVTVTDDGTLTFKASAGTGAKTRRSKDAKGINKRSRHKTAGKSKGASSR